MINILFGPPGTGKTTRLLEILEQEMGAGVEPEEIAFVSFTRKAAEEAMQRVRANFLLGSANFPYFRTLHSLAYLLIGLHHTHVMEKKHYLELGDILGIEFASPVDGELALGYEGDFFVYVDGFARARKMEPVDAWRRLNADWLGYNWFAFRQFQETLGRYKQERNLLDFTDFMETGEVPACPVRVAIIDEAQDLSTLQWMFAMQAFRGVERFYIAGDDDQAVYAWAGADVRHFLGLPGEKTILEQSWRLPKTVHRVAEEVAARITVRQPKHYAPRAENGAVEYYRYPQDVAVEEGNWLVLSRNAYHLRRLAKGLKEKGVYFSYRGNPSVNHEHLAGIVAFEAWRKGKPLMLDEEIAVERLLPEGMAGCPWPDRVWHEVLTGIPLEDREYYVSLLRRGENVLRPPRVALSTIHAVKGGEADHVMLLTDVTNKTFRGQQVSPDNEHRVWYVGVTRARESLHIVLPQTRMSYEL